MDWPTVTAGIASTVVAAGAALVASRLTSRQTLRGVKLTVQSNADDLKARLDAERAATHENREQERRERAYISLVAYVHWIKQVVAVNVTVVDRQLNAVRAVRAADNYLTAGTLAEEAALTAAAPTDQEKDIIAAEPTITERANILALVTALASDEICSKFDELREKDSALSSALRDIRSALTPEARLEPSALDDVLASTQKIDTDEAKANYEEAVASKAAESIPWKLLSASTRLLPAQAEFNRVVEELKVQVRIELKSTRAANARSIRRAG
jgi:hypothetical protein